MPPPRQPPPMGARLFLLFALVAVLLAPVQACLSYDVWHGMLDDCRARSVDSGMTMAQVDCIYSEGEKFAPEIRVIDGAHKQCYDHNGFGVYMAHVVAECVNGPSSSSDSESDEADDDEFEDSTSRQTASTQQLEEQEHAPVRLIRQQMQGDSVVARVARLLNLKVSRRAPCRCNSGCHYCCVLTGIGGEDNCFNLVCRRGSGYCA